MAFQVSPGVQVNEIDATNVVPAVSTSIGGFAGAFNWGPVDEIHTVSSEDNMASVFSTPDSNTAIHFLTAASFLKYGNALKVVRVVASAANNASSVGDATLVVKNTTSYDSQTMSSDQGDWIAKYPGVLGNSLKVEVCTPGGGFAGWASASQFDSAPATSQYAIDKGVTSAVDELHVVVIDEDGELSGKPGTVLETFAFVSQALDAKDSSGTSLYYKDVINAQSNYIWFGSKNSNLAESGLAVSAVGGSFTTHSSILTSSLTGGVDGNTLSSNGAEVIAGLGLLEDADTVDVNLFFTAPDANGTVNIGQDLVRIAGTARKDCMAFISPPVADTQNLTASACVTNVTAYATALGANTSYAAMDSGAVYVYDKYNDSYVWIGSAGLCAGLCANTDNVADAWFSPAGVNRGQLLGVVKLAYNPSKTQRDTLYKAKINPLVSFPGQGTMLYGDKTLLTRASAFDRINVRRLFITLEKAISTAAKAQLFEFNDEFTQAQFRNLLEPFLRDIKGRRGITDFKVICDSTNNPGSVVDGNKFVADIYIKPARSINFITLNFIATRTGVDFSEVAGA